MDYGMAMRRRGDFWNPSDDERPEEAPGGMLPPQGGNMTQPVGAPTPMGPSAPVQTSPVGQPAPMQEAKTYAPQLGRTPTPPGMMAGGSGGGMSLYSLGFPGAVPVSWLSPPNARQNAGPWNPFQGRFSGMVRG